MKTESWPVSGLMKPILSVPDWPNTVPVLVKPGFTVVVAVPAVFSNVPELLNFPPMPLVLSVG